MQLHVFFDKENKDNFFKVEIIDNSNKKITINNVANNSIDYNWQVLKNIFSKIDSNSSLHDYYSDLNINSVNATFHYNQEEGYDNLCIIPYYSEWPHSIKNVYHEDCREYIEEYLV
ncbi:MAG: hypothetical protein J0G32_01050 [Alphaproteobacteria bacterium]|nr:hypothetical protein [Alphaproteobacteria bacterium]OJV13205.1 MAG: hypothetical protein BGO27_00170 [Alphaproteobacteria bacterium 33-17]